MRVEVVTPARAGSQHGNRVTAERWAALLGELGHTVSLTTSWSGEPVDVLVALHARRSADTVRAYRCAHPRRLVVLALTGTDLYADLAVSLEAQESVQAADALVVLQDKAYDVLDPGLHPRVHVIHQSVVPPARSAPPGPHLEVLLLAWFFLTPIFYDAKILLSPAQAEWMLRLNPMASIIERYRQILYWPEGKPDFLFDLRTAATCLVILGVGYLFFTSLNRRLGEHL